MPTPYPDCFEAVVNCRVETLLDDIEGRYLLTVSLNNNCSKTITVAMMNPSKANDMESDDTINKVISFVHEQNTEQKSLVKDIKYINVVNVFPAYEPTSGKLNEKIDKVISGGKLDNMQEKNRRAFDIAVSESDSVVLAWGDVPNKVRAKLHNHEAIMAYEFIQQYGLTEQTFVLKYQEYERVLTNKKRPRHPSWNTPERYVKVNSMRVSRNFLYLEF